METPTRAIGKPSTARGRATRQRILDAAEECFAERGYAAASVAEIVRRSGVSQGSFYVYFPSKQAIFEELIRTLSHEIRRVTRVAVEDAESPVEAEVKGTTAFLGWLQEHRNLHRLLHLIDEVDPALTVEFYSGIAKGYSARLERAIEEGEVQAVDPELLAYVLMGMHEFVSMRWELWSGEAVPPEILDDFARILAGTLRGAS